MSSTTKTTQTSEPPGYAKPWLELAASDAGYLYQNGIGGNVYQGPTYAGLGDMSQGGINNLYQAGNWNSGVTDDVISGSMNNPFVSKLDRLADSVKAQAVDSKLFSDIYNQAGGKTAPDMSVTDIAAGRDLGPDGNPYFNDMLAGQLDQAAGRVNSSMAGAGRLGSGANTGVLADTLGRISSEALYNQYGRDQERQLAATGMIDSARQGRLGTQLGAATGKGQIETGNADRSLRADELKGNLYNSGGQMYGQGLDRALTATNMDFANSLLGARAQIDAGGIQDRDRQATMDDEMALWYANDNRDWERLNMMLGATTGAAGNYGTSFGTSRDPYGGLKAIGGALGGLFGGK